MENIVTKTKTPKPMTQQQYQESVEQLRSSGELDRTARLMSMAFQIFSCANAYTEEANDILAKHGLVVKKLKTASNNLMQSFDAYCKVFSDLVNSGKNPTPAFQQMCFDNQILTELLDAFMKNEITVNRGSYYSATLFLPAKQ